LEVLSDVTGWAVYAEVESFETVFEEVVYELVDKVDLVPVKVSLDA
jgi:hypothetical protein